MTDMKKPMSKGKTCFSQSAHLFTLSIVNQNMQKTIENEEKITFHKVREQRPSHRLQAVEKNNSYKKLVLQVVFCFVRGILIFSGRLDFPCILIIIIILSGPGIDCLMVSFFPCFSIMCHG